MVNNVSFIILLLILNFISPIDAYCIRGRLISQMTRYGNTHQYCDYHGIKILPGSTFKISVPDCVECRCTIQGLRCCGFGYSAGIIAPPPGCTAYNDACNLVFVKQDNLSELCQLSNSTKTNITPSLNRRV